MEEKKVKGSAYKQPEQIKAKSKWTKKTTTGLIVILVIAAIIALIVLWQAGVFEKKVPVTPASMTMDEYLPIQITEDQIEVSDAEVDSYLSSVAAAMSTQDVITEGTLEDGDTIYLSYSGVLDGETEPFEGGTSDGSSLTLGSGQMIPGFEEAIVGHEIGETFDINVTFPEDYSTEDLAGKPATFTITVDHKTVTTTPEMTDELVKEYSETNLNETIETVDALKDYYRENLEHSRMENAIYAALQEKAHIESYDSVKLNELTSIALSNLEYSAAQYGFDGATMASLYGYDSAEAYAEASAKSNLEQDMIISKVAEDLGIEVTDEELDTAIQEYMDTNGLSEQYASLDQFKAAAGDSFTWSYGVSLKTEKVLQSLEEQVEILPAPVEEDEDASEKASEEADEEESEEATEEVSSEATEETTEAPAEETEATAEAPAEETEAVAEAPAEETEAAAEVPAEETEAAAEAPVVSIKNK